MTKDGIPNVGYSQPRYETRLRVTFHPMGAKKSGKRGKRPPTAAAARVRRILSENINGLLHRFYPLTEYKKVSYQQQELARDVKVSWSSVQRALDTESGNTLDLIADFAAGLGVAPGDLLTKNFYLQYKRKPGGGDDDSTAADELHVRQRP